eukprot:GHVU01222627.1.p1 GENE.GHVU01222627.1~~GHVU01222627.1.p1  ORF type:complete len:112 (+),score=0.60 GHVU01222627.1:267-602(+)
MELRDKIGLEPTPWNIQDAQCHCRFVCVTADVTLRDVNQKPSSSPMRFSNTIRSFSSAREYSARGVVWYSRKSIVAAFVSKSRVLPVRLLCIHSHNAFICRAVGGLMFSGS